MSRDISKENLHFTAKEGTKPDFSLITQDKTVSAMNESKINYSQLGTHHKLPPTMGKMEPENRRFVLICLGDSRGYLHITRVYNL